MRNRSKTVCQFFDFYALNEIWFQLVGHTEYGYAPNKIIPYNKESYINESFQKCISCLKKDIIENLERSVRGEFKNIKTYGLYFRHEREIDKIYKKYKYIKRKNLSLEAIFEHFNCDWYDGAYGGRKWGEGVNFLIMLKNSKSIKDDIFYIDRIFDLQHNNGFILNKTKFKLLEARRTYGNKYVNALDFRFQSKVPDLIKYASYNTKKVYLANKNYLPTYVN